MDNRKIDLVDFHAHILPGADHGSDSIETSIKQLKLAAAEGVTRIIATPHFYPHRHTLDKFLEKRAACAKVLSDACDGTLPAVKLGAEVLLCPGLDKFDGLENLCLSGTKYLLLELPFSDFRDSYFKSIEALLDKGYDIIIAHADRYPEKNIETLLELKVKLQLNADALSGFFIKKHIKKTKVFCM